MFKLADVRAMQSECAVLKMPGSSCLATGDIKEGILGETLMLIPWRKKAFLFYKRILKTFSSVLVSGHVRLTFSCAQEVSGDTSLQ